MRRSRTWLKGAPANVLVTRVNRLPPSPELEHASKMLDENADEKVASPSPCISNASIATPRLTGYRVVTDFIHNQQQFAPQNFKVGEKVLVWSNPQSKWLEGAVSQVASSDFQKGEYKIHAGAVEVAFGDTLQKWIQPRHLGVNLKRA